MSAARPAPGTGSGRKGLKNDALGMFSSVVIGLASTAPACSLAATQHLLDAAAGPWLGMDDVVDALTNGSHRHGGSRSHRDSVPERPSCESPSGGSHPHLHDEVLQCDQHLCTPRFGRRCLFFPSLPRRPSLSTGASASGHRLTSSVFVPYPR
jgi:hypothetical protein